MNKKHIFYIVIFLQATFQKDNSVAPLGDNNNIHLSNRIGIDLNYFPNEGFYKQKKLPILIISSNVEQRSNSLIILPPKKRALIEQGGGQDNDPDASDAKN